LKKKPLVLARACPCNLLSGDEIYEQNVSPTPNLRKHLALGKK